MIRVSQWAEIRHLHLVDGVPKKEVARRLGLDVKTVRRALGRDRVPLVRQSPARGSSLDPWKARIEDLLKADARISAKRIARILEPESGRLQERTVRKYVAALRKELRPKEAFVHRTPQPGDAMEVDFGESWAEIAGRRRKVKYVVTALPASNAYFAKAYPMERLECLMDAMAEAFTWLGGVPRRAVLDNTSLAVKKVLKGKDRLETDRFHAFRGEWLIHVDFCAPGKGWEKGSVERGVEYVRGLVFRPMPKMESFDALNAWIVHELDHDLDLRKLTDGRTARQALVAEREHLRPLPEHRPETCRVIACVADKYGHVRVDRCTYSLPTRYARTVVTCKVFHDRIELAVDADVIARHVRSFREGAMVIDPLHVLKLLEQKHRAVGESTAIAQWKLPGAFYELREKLRAKVRKPDQEWIGVLRLIEKHEMSDVEAAVLGALERDSPRLHTVRMLLRQEGSDPSCAEPIELAREELAALDVAMPDLSAWDVLCTGGEQ